LYVFGKFPCIPLCFILQYCSNFQKITSLFKGDEGNSSGIHTGYREPGFAENRYLLIPANILPKLQG